METSGSSTRSLRIAQTRASASSKCNVPNLSLGESLAVSARSERNPTVAHTLILERRIAVTAVGKLPNFSRPDWKGYFKNKLINTQKTKAKSKKQKTKETKHGSLIRLTDHFCPAVHPLFSQPARVVVSYRWQWNGREGFLLPSSEMEDREEKADYPTVVVHDNSDVVSPPANTAS